MKLVIFGLSISSSWGNGHATLWRGLCRAFATRGHKVVFFERDVPYYAAHRDLLEFRNVELVLYRDWSEVVPLARTHLLDADAGMITSYCPDGIQATDLLFCYPTPVTSFYDLDSPVTLEHSVRGEPVAYIGPRGLRDFDLVFSYAGGTALEELRARLGATRVVALYGSVDPESHYPVPALSKYASDMSYLGTYSEDRQSALESLFVEPALRLPAKKFLMAGPLYPATFPWTSNIHYLNHVPPGEHPAFYCSSLFTLNVTRRPMANVGYCPSGRLFEAAACQVPVVTDEWQGIELFFEPGREILVARSADEVIDIFKMSREELGRIARAARERCLSNHTAEHRAVEMESALESACHARELPDNVLAVESNNVGNRTSRGARHQNSATGVF